MLSLFIPIVLALGESVSMQALTLTLQGLTDGPVVWKRLIGSLWKEFKTATMLAGSCAALVGLVVVAWRGQPMVAGSIFLAITLLDDHRVPDGRDRFRRLLRAAKADPRIAAGPVVLAVADVVTLVFYFGLGSRLLG